MKRENENKDYDCEVKRQRQLYSVDLCFIVSIIRSGPFVKYLGRDAFALCCISWEMYQLLKKEVEKAMWFDGTIEGQRKYFQPLKLIFAHPTKVDLKAILPDGLRKLYVGFGSLTVPKLPDSLVKLCLDGVLNADRLPAGLRVLEVRPDLPGFHHIYLPSGLKKLVFRKEVHLPLQPDQLEGLPNGLEELDLGAINRFRGSMDKLPESLKILRLPKVFKEGPLMLPRSLEVLHMGEWTDDTLDYANLPATLRELTVSKDFCLPLRVLPETLQKVHLRSGFRQLLEDLPKGLVVIGLDCNYLCSVKRLNCIHQLLSSGWTVQSKDGDDLLFDGLVLKKLPKCL